MASRNGQCNWGFQPVDFTNSDLEGAFYSARDNYLKSVNDPLRYQVVWKSTNLTEATEPSISNSTATSGDVVYVKFYVEVCMNTDDAAINGWEQIAVITKTRDIINKKYDTGTAAPNHRFTVDVSQVVSDELSYSLCPVNKGTWQSYKYGGMNGGAIMQDNVISNDASLSGNPVSLFNVSKNGTFRRLRVKAVPYVILDDGDIEPTGTLNSNTISVINSVNQISSDGVYYAHNNYGGSYLMANSSASSTIQSYKFLSKYNNYLYSTGSYGKKLVRMDEQAEFLNFYFYRIDSESIGGSAGEDTVRACGMYVETFTSDGIAQNQFYIRDFEDTLLKVVNASLGMHVLKDYQNVMTTQNVSPYFIKNTANCYTYNDSGSAAFPYWTAYSGDKITSDTDCYRVSIYRFSGDTPANSRRTSEYRYYKIDREDENEPYKFVRFHWLNNLGSTDSYTAKRNIAEGYTINRNTIEANTTDKTWYQNSTNVGTDLDTDMYKSDTMRGGDIYKGGREVTSVEAQRVQSVYTEPLNTEEAEWLSKMMLSPNVWVEMNNDATKVGNLYNTHLRPSTRDYIPIIITNSDVETVNQEQGLVTFNIEYTLAHKTITQSN
tara:strand:+ start:3605 stop:5419 length:1815 start_codon:yes stop_codon:yes gene_type:complete